MAQTPRFAAAACLEDSSIGEPLPGCLRENRWLRGIRARTRLAVGAEELRAGGPWQPENPSVCRRGRPVQRESANPRALYGSPIRTTVSLRSIFPDGRVPSP